MHTYLLVFLLIFSLSSVDINAKSLVPDTNKTKIYISDILKSSEYIRPKLGIYITSLTALNPKQGSFDIIFWTWFVHNSKDYEPEKTVEVTNITEIQSFYELEAEEKKSFDEENNSQIWNNQKFKATILHHWNLKEYPFDRHELKIKFEDAEFDSHRLKFEVDLKNSKISKELQLDGWYIEKLDLVEHSHIIDTNFGDPSIKDGESSYSQVTVSVYIRRDGMRDFINIFGPIYLAFFLSWLGYFIKEAYDIKITLFLSSVFMLIANKDIIDSTIPVTSEVTLLDKVQFLTFISVTFFVVIITLSMYMKGKGMMNKDDKLYQISMYFISMIYLFGNAYFFKDIF